MSTSSNARRSASRSFGISLLNAFQVTRLLLVALCLSMPAAAVSFSPSSFSVSDAAVSTRLYWTGASGYYTSATPSVAWITVTDNTSSPTAGNIGLYINSNTSSTARSGYVRVCAGSCTNVNVSQAGRFIFTVTVTPTDLTPAAAGESGTLSATPNAATTYTVDVYDDWIHITSGTTLSGNQTISYTIDANTTGSARSTEFYVDSTTISVYQEAAAVTGSLTLSPTSASPGSSGGTGTISATSNLPSYAWTAVSNNAWITVTSGASRTGSGSVGYSVAANTSVSSRSGSITIGDKTFSVTQAGLTGSVTLSPTSLSPVAAGATGTVSATANASDYAYTAVSNNAWITVTSGASRTGSGSVGYSVAANTSTSSRSGSITIGDKTFSVSQAGLTGSLTLSPTSLSAATAGETGTVSATANASDYAWTAVSNNAWITVTSGASRTGSGSVGYSVAANTSVSSRSGSITIGDKTFSVTQAGLTGSLTLSPTSLSAVAAGESGTVSATANVSDYAWTAVSNNAWITVTSGASTTGSGSVGYTVAASTSVSSRTGSITIGDKTFSVTQAAVTGSVTLSPTSLSAAGAGESGSVTVTSNATDYAWTAVSNNAWITVTSGASTTGSGSVGYTVAANPSVASRSGSITIGDKTFSVSQAGATGSVTLSPTSLSPAAAGETGTVSATANASDYAWTAVSNNAWITVTSGASTTGSGSVGYSVAANTSTVSRTGSITIGDKTFSVTQAGVAGSVTLSPTSLNAVAAGESGTVSATANVSDYAWTAVSNNAWITVTSGASTTGNGSVGYTVAASTSISSRTGSITIGDKTFSVTQAGVTGSVALSPTSLNAVAAGESGSVTVTSNATDYAWTAVSNNAWITVTSGASTTGSGTVGYTVAASNTINSRTGSITIGDKTFSVTQAGVTGSVTLGSSSVNAVAAGESGSVTATANVSDYAWTAVSNNTWITVTSGASTTGNGSVGYTVAANGSTASRTGSITVGDKTFTVTQAGLVGSVTLSPSSLNAGTAGESGSVTATANASDYAWTAVSDRTWLSVTSGASTTGSGTVGYTVAAATTVASRSGSITIGDKTFAVTQAGLTGSVTLSPTSLSAVAAGESGSITVSSNATDYAWTAVSNNPWITVTSGASGTGSGTVGYTVAATNSISSRSGSITIGDKTFTVTQAGVTGSVTLSPASLSAAGAGESGSITVSSNATDYAWTAVSNNAWITVTSGASGTGNGTVGYTVAASTTIHWRNGSITIGDKTFTVTQAGATGSVTLGSSSVNAVAAGESGSVTATANVSDYAWTAVSNNAWLTVTSGASTTGNGSLGYTVAANPSTAARNGSITIGDKTFSVAQAGLVGSVSLSPASLNAVAAGESGSITASANASDYAWTAVSNNAWITVTSGASTTGSGTVGYTVAAATTVASRTGSITIGDKTFSVTQAGKTGSVTLGSSSLNAVAAGESHTLTVTSNAPDFVWTAVSNQAWITVTSGASTTGSGSVGYTVAAATTVATRSGSITIGDKTFTITQAGLTGSVTLSPASLNAVAAGQSGSITATANAPDYAWTAVSNNTWITVTSGASTTGSGTVGYTVAAATTVASRTGSVTIGDKTFTITQAGMVGSVTLNPATVNAVAAGQSGSTTATANAPDYAWTAVSNNAWITVTSGASTTGNGSVGYTVAAATTVASRTGSITLGDKTFTVTQAGMVGSLSLNSSSLNAVAAGQSGSITATSNAPDFNWTAVSNNTWITVTAGASTTGSGTVSYTVAAATTVATRTGSITIGDKTFTITQAGLTGSVTLSPASLNAVAAGQSGTITTTANAPDYVWTAVSNNPWITVTAGANTTGSGSVGYTVAAATTVASRTGSITIGDKTFTIIQAGMVGSVTLAPATLNAVAAGQSGSITATSNAPDYVWTAVSNNPWITVTAGANTTGSGSVGYTVAAATTVASRTGSITIGDKTFTITQAGMVGSVALSPASLNAVAAGQSGSITATSNAPDYVWTAVSNNPWITVTAGANTTGSGSVGYTVAAATTVASRTGSITIGDKTFTIAQAGMVGSVTLGAPSQNATAEGGSQTLTVTSNAPDFVWTAVSNQPWITVTAGASTTGSGSVGYTVAPATTVASRTGTITIGDKTFTITQAGMVGSVTLNPTALNLDRNGGHRVITVTSNAPDYAWTAVSNRAWITVVFGASTTGSGTVTIAVDSPDTLATRTGAVTIGDKSLTVTQTGLTGSVALGPSSANAVAAGQSGTVAVTSNATDYTWTAISNQPWITVTGGSPTTGSGSVSYSVAASTSVATRNGSITIGDREFPITQSGITGSVTLAPAEFRAAAGGQSGNITVTSNATDYAWTAVSGSPWITITSGAGATGNGTVAFTVAPATTVATRTGTIVIGDKTFTITQAGASGSVTLDRTSANATADGVNGSITVHASASDYTWTVSSNKPWITVSSAASITGDGTVTYSVAATNTSASRSGTITIGGQTFTITQAGGEVKVTATPNRIPMTAAGGTASIVVSANYSDGTWTAAADAPWLTVVSGPSFTGNATVTVQVAEQKSLQSRTGTVTIGGQTVTVVQSGGQGTLVLSDTQISMEAAGGTRAVTVATNYSDYAWTAVSRDSWITVSPAGGTGSGTLSLQIARLETGTSRTGTVVVEGSTITVTQTSGVILSPTVLTLTAPTGGGTARQSLTVTGGATATSFTATVSADAPWLSVDVAQGTTPAVITVSANPAGLAAGNYQGTITINGQRVSVYFTVSKPLVSLSLSSVYFQKTNEGVDLAPKVIILSADGGPVTYSASIAGTTPSWLTLSGVSGSVPGAVQMSVSTAGLTAGEYNAVLVLSLTGASADTLTVPVTLRIPQLAVTVVSISGSPVVGSQNVGNGQVNLVSNAQDSQQALPGAELLVDSLVPQAFSASTTLPGGGNWLTVSPASGTTPAKVKVNADRTGLAPGTYTGYVNVAAGEGAASSEARSRSVTLAVTFTVDAPAKTVSLNPSSLAVTRTKGSNTVQQFTLKVSGTAGQLFYAAAKADWIRVTPSTGQAPTTVQVEVDPSRILSDSVSSAISFTTPDAPATPTLVPVTVTTPDAAPVISMEQSWADLTAEESGAAATTSIRLNSSASGTAYTVASTQPWLSATPSTGTAPATVTVSASPAGLKAGSYSGDLVFRAGATELTLHVVLGVNPKPSFDVSGGPVSLRLIENGTTGTEASLSLSARVRNVNFTSAVSGGNWLEVSSDVNTTPAVLRVATTAEALKLKAGVYDATLTVSSNDGADPVTIAVQLTVDAGAAVLEQPEIVSYAGGSGGAVAPGMLITLKGLKLPVEQAVTANLDSRVAPQQLGGVRVLFDGLAGPVLSVSAAEVTAMVPYELGMKASTVVTLEYLGQSAAPMVVPMVAARPELVPVAEAAGSWARHTDGTPVSASAPALPGSIIEIVVNGLGITTPGLSSTVVQTQAVPVTFGGTLTVTYDGKPAEVLFASPKPGQVPGLIEINLRVPADAASGGAIGLSL